MSYFSEFKCSSYLYARKAQEARIIKKRCQKVFWLEKKKFSLKLRFFSTVLSLRPIRFVRVWAVDVCTKSKEINNASISNDNKKLEYKNA